jgi:alpha/beta superfamily hydrolase
VRLTLEGPAGPLEALLDEPVYPPAAPANSQPTSALPATAGRLRAAVVFAHPHPQHGGTMHTKAVFQGAKGLTRIGCAVLRFNFRGVGASGGTFGDGAGEQADYRAALDFVAARYPDAAIWAAGFSFGAWIALEVGADDPRVSVLIGVSPPVSRPNYSFERVLASAKPKFLIQGDLDEQCPVKDLWVFYARLKDPKELVLIDGASHLFEGKTREVGDALEDLLGDFE